MENVQKVVDEGEHSRFRTIHLQLNKETRAYVFNKMTDNETYYTNRAVHEMWEKELVLDEGETLL